MRRRHGVNAPPKKSKTGKRAVNVSIRADLVDEAKAFGTNISAVVERALEEEHRERRREKWRRENHEAIGEANSELADHGLWSDGLRTF
jgi:antitoxin CcdA